MAADPPSPATPLPALRAPRWAKGLLVVVFFGCLGAGFLLTFFGPGGRRKVSHIEKRTLAPEPGWPRKSAALASFPKRCEAWVNDHLYAREHLVGVNSFLQVKLLGQSPVPDVIIGQQGWLYYNIGKTINDYRGLERFTPTQLAFMRAYLTVRRDWFRRRGVPYVFVVAPDKHTVYPDFLPDRYRRKVREGTLLDQFLAEMARSEGDAEPVAILDLRPAVRQARQRAEVFYRTDTHWNEAGGRVGARVILDWVRTQFPDRQIPPTADEPPSVTTGRGGDLASELGLTRTMRDTYPHWPMPPEVVQPPYREPGLEPWHPLASLYVREDGAADLRAIFLHDSYAHAMKSSLTAAFRESLFLGRPGDMHLASHALVSQLVGTFQPDVVIEEVVERNLADYFFGDAAMEGEMVRYVADE